MKAIRTLLGLCLLAGLLTVPSLEAAASNGSRCWNASDTERGFVRKMNRSRLARDLGKLTLDPELSRAARKHTVEMVDSDQLFHTGLDRLGRWVTRWTTLGENVGYGTSVTSLHKAFMNSATHRANVLLDRYNHVGVSAARDGDGKLWVTIVFESTTDPGTTLKMPRC